VSRREFYSMIELKISELRMLRYDKTLNIISIVFLMLFLSCCRRIIPKSLHVQSMSIKTKSPRREGLGKPKGYASDSLRYKLQQHTLSGLPNTSRVYKVLGIESSCDDTGVGVVQSDGKILSNVVYSQYSIHEKFGGIVPMLAMNAHKDNIDIALQRALADAGLQSVDEVDAIAVTKGPGLEICLRVGINKAKVRLDVELMISSSSDASVGPC
jgi:hypothetical protein